MQNQSQPLSLYIHIPFCRSRCTYCAFNTYTGLGRLFEPYVCALRQELVQVSTSGESKRRVAHTVYLGGGTPSLLSVKQIASVLDACATCFTLTSDCEISMEANPRTINLRALRELRAIGISRLSIGVQSSEPEVLQAFNRQHDFDDAVRAFRDARRAGFDNVNVDLIYGAPHQTRGGWNDTLHQVLSWEPDHIALYSLFLEPGTFLHRQVELGALTEPNPDLAADMYDSARDALARAGLRQYELSNWARPGLECLHNQQYWRNLPYLGFGAGAYGASSAVRYWNVKGVADYIGRIEKGAKQEFPRSPAMDGFEIIDTPTAIIETMFLQLRLVRDGLNRDTFANRFGVSLEEVFGDVIPELVDVGLLRSDNDALRLSEKGYLISNQVFIRLMESGTHFTASLKAPKPFQ